MIKNFIPKSMLFILLLLGGLSTAFAQTGTVKGVSYPKIRLQVKS